MRVWRMRFTLCLTGGGVFSPGPGGGRGGGERNESRKFMTGMGKRVLFASQGTIPEKGVSPPPPPSVSTFPYLPTFPT